MTYLQYEDLKGSSELPVIQSPNYVTPSDYRIMSYDVLFIRVITPDPQWSAIFNVTSTGTGGMVTQESAILLGYPVDVEGRIEIPYVGKIAVEGKTLEETKVVLDSIFKNYVTNAAITVRLVNNFVSILGEVRNAGRYPITKDRLTIFEALSLAGDLAEFSDRQKVQMIRPSRYGPVVKEFSLRDRSILTSEFYYVMPNDIIYAPPLKGRSFQTNSQVWTLITGSVATILTSITTILVILNYNQTP